MTDETAPARLSIMVTEAHCLVKESAFFIFERNYSGKGD
jgi:hypothetical protein